MHGYHGILLARTKGVSSTSATFTRRLVTSRWLALVFVLLTMRTTAHAEDEVSQMRYLGAFRDDPGRVVYALAEHQALSAAQWQTLARDGMLERVLPGFFKQAYLDGTPALQVLESIFALSTSGVSLTPRTKAEVDCWLAFGAMDRAAKRENKTKDSDGDKEIAQALQLTGATLDTYLTFTLPSPDDLPPAPTADEKYEVFLNMESQRRIETAATTLRLMLYHRLKPLSDVALEKDLQHFSPQLRTLLLKDREEKEVSALFQRISAERRAKQLEQIKLAPRSATGTTK